MWRLRQHATKWIHMWLRSRSFWLNSNAANWCQYAAPQTCEYGRAKKGEQRARRKKINQMCRLYVFILDRKYRILRHPYIIESKKDWFTSVCYVSIEHEFWGAFQRERRKTISSIFIRTHRSRMGAHSRDGLAAIRRHRLLILFKTTCRVPCSFFIK